MLYRLIVAGVGGQGILSIAGIIAKSAKAEGLYFKQSEIHGMSQRGGAVFANISISDKELKVSNIIPTGKADMILSMEPLESLRYLDKLSASGVLITSSKPVENIAKYPNLDMIYEDIQSIPKSILADVAGLAKVAGSSHTANVVLVGIAAKHLPISENGLLRTIENAFSHKGEKIIEANKKAFTLGQNFDATSKSKEEELVLV